MNLFDKTLSKPILPNRGAAGLKLGDSDGEVYKNLGEPIEKKEVRQGMYKLNYGKVTVWLDDRKVTQIGLNSGYLGMTEDGVGVGTTKEELKEKWGYDIAHNKGDDYWEFMSKPGTLFNFEKNKEGEDIVSEIYVVSP